MPLTSLSSRASTFESFNKSQPYTVSPLFSSFLSRLSPIVPIVREPIEAIPFFTQRWFPSSAEVKLETNSQLKLS